jgi:ABC-type branched-subunit amino acid transport system permease subunit
MALSLLSIALSALVGLSVFTPPSANRISLAGVGFMILGGTVAAIVSGPAHGVVLVLLVAAAASAAFAGMVIDAGLKNADAKTFAIATLAFSVVMALYASAHRYVPSSHQIAAPSRYSSTWEAGLVLALCVAVCYAATGSRFSFAAGAMAAGLAGAIVSTSAAQPLGTTALIELLAFAVSIAVIGGRRSAFGPPFGALLAALALPLTHIAGLWSVYLIGPLIVIALIWLPDGLFGLAQQTFDGYLRRRADGAA